MAKTTPLLVLPRVFFSCWFCKVLECNWLAPKVLILVIRVQVPVEPFFFFCVSTIIRRSGFDHSPGFIFSRFFSGSPRRRGLVGWVWAQMKALRFSTRAKFQGKSLKRKGFIRIKNNVVFHLNGFDHINRNAPVLIRTPKLTRFEPAQYWGGGPPGNSVVLNPNF